MGITDSFYNTGVQILNEQSECLKKIDLKSLETVLKVISKAHTIFLYGVGREGLMMKAFGMRLFHLGLKTHITGDMTSPPIKKGDLLITSAGPGYFSTVNALIEIAIQNHAQVLCFTSEPSGKCPQKSNHTFLIPAQTMTSNQSWKTSTLPMGSQYEIMQFLVFELLILILQKKMKLKPQTMQSQHTNME